MACSGQFKCKEKKPTVVLEASADWELWMWGCNFRKPGSLHDINFIDNSPLKIDILQGFMLHDFEYELNKRKHKSLYVLVDGIYPHWDIFISTNSEGGSKKEKTI